MAKKNSIQRAISDYLSAVGYIVSNRDISPLRVILSYKYTCGLLSNYCPMFCNLNRFLLASKRTDMAIQFSSTFVLFSF